MSYRRGAKILPPENIKVGSLLPNAEHPRLTGSANTTFVITAVARTEDRLEDEVNQVNEFRTGLVFEVPKGRSAMIFPHPSLARQGYVFGTSPILLDAVPGEELIIPLIKFREIDDLQLPFEVGLIVPLQPLDMQLSKVPVRQILPGDDEVMDLGTGRVLRQAPIEQRGPTPFAQVQRNQPQPQQPQPYRAINSGRQAAGHNSRVSHMM